MKKQVEERRPIKVSLDVLEGIEEVRVIGATKEDVIKWCRERRFEEAARWIETHPEEYKRGVSRGFEVDHF
jgi:hypothetical protein